MRMLREVRRSTRRAGCSSKQLASSLARGGEGRLKVEGGGELCAKPVR